VDDNLTDDSIPVNADTPSVKAARPNPSRSMSDGKTTDTTIIAMTCENDTLGGRLPLADPTTLTGAQRELFDTMMTTWVPSADDAGFQSTTVDGRFIGPFNPLLLRPAVASKFLDLQFAEQSHTSLSERVRQVVILAVGAAWGADYELYAHSAVARKAGISEDAIRTLADGGLPDDLGEHEKIAARVARQLSTSHRIDDGLYRIPGGRTSIRQGRAIRRRHPHRHLSHSVRDAHHVRRTRSCAGPLRRWQPTPWHVRDSPRLRLFRSASSWKTLLSAATVRSW
jgi:4-carboxymuconolactone decarboxylase